MTDKPVAIKSESAEKAKELIGLIQELHTARKVLLFSALDATEQMADKVFGARVSSQEGRSDKANTIWDTISRSGTTPEFQKMMADISSAIIGEQVQPSSSVATLADYPFAMLVPISNPNSNDYVKGHIAVLNKNGENKAALRYSAEKGNTMFRNSDEMFRCWRLPNMEQLVEYFMTGDHGGPTVKQISSFYGSLTIENMPDIPSNEVLALRIVKDTDSWEEINAALDALLGKS